MNLLEEKKNDFENKRVIYTVQEVASLLHSSPDYRDETKKLENK